MLFDEGCGVSDVLERSEGRVSRGTTENDRKHSRQSIEIKLPNKELVIDDTLVGE
jgi:hypothetical protein